MRSAHEAVGKLVRLCEERRCRLADLPAEEYESVRPGLTPGVYKVLGVANALAAFRSVGSTAPAEVEQQLQSVAAAVRTERDTKLRCSSRPRLHGLEDPWIIFTTATASCTAKTCPCRSWPQTYGTPLYVYSKATLLHHLRPVAAGLRRRAIRSSATASRPTATCTSAGSWPSTAPAST